MKYRYSRYIADLANEIDLESLVTRLSDLLLASGFNTPWDPRSDDDRTMQALHDAILDALLNGGVLSDEMLERLMDGQMDESSRADAEGRQRGRDELEELVQRIIEKLTEQGYITMAGPPTRQRFDGPGAGGDAVNSRFEVTDKALDFLGYRALRDLLGSAGRSSAGRHDTRELDSGIEAGGPPRQYLFGDTLNLDAAATVLSAVQRQTRQEAWKPGSSARGPRGAFSPAAGGGAPATMKEASESASATDLLKLTYEDLMITQGDYQSSCATCLLLDCSHSMVLYGEDRFTPAKRVAMALANLIRHQYPGDALSAVLFHDSAEEVPISQLGRVKVGPYYTNTREGLRLARRVLDRQRKDMRQIIMITDGKPSAVTRPDGRIYRNAFGLDPFVLRETLAEVAACRRSGIMINTFMLARDYDLVAFVRRVARICRGKAYFTTPYTLGQYVLMDFLSNKTRTVH
jgi:Ca-activated chloride channel homolog